MQAVTINKNQAGQRLDKFLKKYLPEAGSSFLYKMLRKKNITLNGKRAEGKEMLSVGDEVKFFFSDETFAKFSGRTILMDTGIQSASSQKGSNVPQDMKVIEIAAASQKTEQLISETLQAFQKLHGISVLYEDENVLIVNKPVGILTQKASPRDLSLNEWLVGYLLDKQAITSEELDTFRPSVCNRLDRNTSGIVLCGKSLAGSQALSQVIKERTIRKFYHTICIGVLTQDTTLEGYLCKDEAANRVTVTNVFVEKNDSHRNSRKKIQTAYHPLVNTDQYTLLEVELITGKTHQIRAHLSSTGHPLIGDYKYGSMKVNNQLKEAYGLEAQLLHAHHVIFPETIEGVLAPLSGRTITATSPKQFQTIQKELKLEYL